MPQAGYFRAGGHAIARWPGSGEPVAIFPLSSARLDAAEHEARASFLPTADPRREAKPRLLDLREQLAILSLALREPQRPHAPIVSSTEQLEELLSPPEAGLLYAQWLDVQTESVPDSDALYRTLLGELAERSTLRCLDGLRASETDSPADFLGVPLDHASDGQLCYFVALKAAHEKIYPREPLTTNAEGKLVRKETTISRQWLNARRLGDGERW